MTLDITEATKTRQQQVDDLNEEAMQLVMSDPTLALDKAEAAKALALQAKTDSYAAGVAQSEIALSRASYALSQFESALQLAISAENWANQTNDPSILVIALGCVGSAYARLSNYVKGMAYFNQQLSLAKQLGNLKQQGVAHRGLTIIHGETEQFQESAYHAAESLAIATALDDKQKMAASYANLCRTKTHSGEFEQAIEFGFKAWSIAKAHVPHLISAACASLAFCYSELDHYDEAIRFYKLALESLAENQNSYFQAITSVEIARAYKMCNELELAQEYAVRALNSAEESQNQWAVFQAHELLSELAEQQGDYKSALHHHKLFEQIQTAAVGEKNAKHMRQLQIAYEVDEARREAELYRLRTEALSVQVDERTVDLQEALEREKVLVNNLAQALAKSEATNELRAKIITTISHEFRTPITVLNTSFDLLIQHRDKLSAEKHHKLQRRFKDSIAYLTSLLEDINLVELSPENSIVQTQSTTPFADLCLALEGEIDDVLHHPKNVLFTFDKTCQQVVNIDSQKLFQVTQNLVKNALMYSPDAESILVEITLNERTLMLSITDKGIGILQDELSQIFDLFYRGSNIGQLRGLGVGLHITKTLVESMGGTIDAHSQGADLGSRFSVCIPFAQRVP